MKKSLIIGVTAIVVWAAAASEAIAAERGSAREFAGFSSGAIIGGALAGPPGVVVGAAVGSVFGDRAERKQRKLDALATSLSDRERALAARDRELAVQQQRAASLQRALAELDASGARELHALLNKGLSLDVAFTTDDASVSVDASERIGQIATLLAELPGLSVQIDGYADQRGSVEYNQSLSLARAENVRELLSSAGVDPYRITTFGHGESMTGSEAVSADELALQRRVTVTFYRERSAVADVAALQESPE